MGNLKAIIKDGLIHDIIVASDEHASAHATKLSGTHVDVTEVECAIGWSYDGTNFTSPPEEVTPTLEAEEKAAMEIEWRNAELLETDSLVPVTDLPNHAKLLEYRQALRNWPSTSDFPDTRPEFSV